MQERDIVLAERLHGLESCVDDPSFAHYETLRALPPHVMKELERFFKDYKALEGKNNENDPL